MAAVSNDPIFAPPQDSAGECDSVAKRRHSQDRGKPIWHN